MPWKRPSSQPTSCACAIRSSDSDGVDSLNGSISPSRSSPTSGGGAPLSSPVQLVTQLGREALLELADRGAQHPGEPRATRLVHRRGLDLLEQHADHAA